MKNAKVPRVVIIGAGFGGLQAAKKLAQLPVHITLIDRNNHHTFQPFLYQVASTLLSPAQIATPLRAIFRGCRNVEVILGEVTGIDKERRFVVADGMEFPYDYLIVAAGARHSYSGHDKWEKHAPGLKTVEDALEIRRRILLALELAEREAVARRKAGLSGEEAEMEPLNLVVIGAGPTGVELAGVLIALTRIVMEKDFRGIDPTRVRIVLVGSGPRVLPAFAQDISASAETQLRELGVDVRTSSRVTDIGPGWVRIGEEILPSAVTVWATGVAASPLARFLSAQLDRAGRVSVEADLSLLGHPEVFAIGDMASAKGADGKPLPGLASVAEQQGNLVAQNIEKDLQQRPRKPFRYRDYGLMATIGRRAAVVQWGKLRLSRTLAWLTWAFVHAMLLLDFRSRSSVLREWAWSIMTGQTSARLITGSRELAGSERGHQPVLAAEQAKAS